MNETVLDLLQWMGSLIGLLGVPLLWYLHQSLSAETRDTIDALHSKLKALDSHLAELEKRLNVQALTHAAERTPHMRPNQPPPVAAPTYREPLAPMTPLAPLALAPFREQPADFDLPIPPQRNFGDEAFCQPAAESLRSLAQFHSFTATFACHFYTLPSGGISTEPATTSDPASADIWAVEDGVYRLVFPGYGLRRMQSALVADAGRLARERVGWLFDIEAGPELGAKTPARIKKGEWSVITKGVLAVPL